MADPRKSGRRFERLVFLIEQLRAADARVEFNARVAETVSRRLRQIDIAIWVPSQHGELLIQVECRDTKRKLDATNVEQLLKKREAVGAALLVIVSPTGFTGGARTKAQLDPQTKLLNLNEKGEADWPDWLRIDPLEVRTLRWEAVDPQIFAEPGRGGPQLGTYQVLSDEKWKEAPVFEVDGRRLSLGQIMLKWFNASGGEKLLKKASTIVQVGTVHLEFSRGRAYLVGDESAADAPEIWEIAFTIEYWFDVTNVPFRLFAYADVEGSSEIQIEPVWVTDPFASFDGEHRLAIAAEPGSGELRWVVGRAD